jgi:SEC-C motif-containing protein
MITGLLGVIVGVLCPCHSGKPYSDCCQKYHAGEVSENALALTRSRYSAYALGDADYIIVTTHPDNPGRMTPLERWRDAILSFSHSSSFTGLDIISFVDGGDEAYVTFTAHIMKGSNDVSFTETSRFVRCNGRWLYRDGCISTEDQRLKDR